MPDQLQIQKFIEGGHANNEMIGRTDRKQELRNEGSFENGKKASLKQTLNHDITFNLLAPEIYI
jgi:hypothetical protein